MNKFILGAIVGYLIADKKTTNKPLPNTKVMRTRPMVKHITPNKTVIFDKNGNLIR